ncbi:MAG: hypothetical protein ABI720_05085 [Actinomycetes bacterium]
MRQALIDVVGLDLIVVAVLDPSASGASTAAAAPAIPATPAKQTPPPPAAAEARAAAAAVDRPVVGRVAESDDDEVDLDDANAEDDGLAGPDLIAQQLGGTVIGEIDHV